MAAQTFEIPAQERRRTARSSIMLPALVDQYPATVTDISFGGIGLGAVEIFTDREIALSAGQVASLRLLDSAGFGEGIEIEIIRVSARQGRLGARFRNLTEAQSRFIKHVVAKRD